MRLWWPYEQVRQTQGAYADEEVRLQLEGETPEILLVSDPAFLTALRRMAPDRTGHVHDPVHRTLRAQLTVLAAVAVVGIVAGLYAWGIPGLATVVAPHVPVSWEERLGSAVVEHVAPETNRCRDPYRARLLNEVVTPLTAAVPGAPYTFRMIVVNNPAVNAFAAPGGSIVVFRGLLERTRTPEELAGVLAHELQHVLQRHTTRMILEQASTGLLLAALSGDPSGAMIYGLEGAHTLGMLRYSRRHEEEADSAGMRMLQAAGIDPGGMIEFFQVLQKETRGPSGLLEYLSTHPRTEDRVQRLRTMAAFSSSPRVKLLQDFDWHFVRAICQAAGR